MTFDPSKINPITHLSDEISPKLREEHPEWSGKDVVVAVTKQWKALTPEQQKAYVDKAAAEGGPIPAKEEKKAQSSLGFGTSKLSLKPSGFGPTATLGWGPSKGAPGKEKMRGLGDRDSLINRKAATGVSAGGFPSLGHPSVRRRPRLGFGMDSDNSSSDEDREDNFSLNPLREKFVPKKQTRMTSQGSKLNQQRRGFPLFDEEEEEDDNDDVFLPRWGSKVPPKRPMFNSKNWMRSGKAAETKKKDKKNESDSSSDSEKQSKKKEKSKHHHHHNEPQFQQFLDPTLMGQASMMPGFIGWIPMMCTPMGMFPSMMPMQMPMSYQMPMQMPYQIPMPYQMPMQMPMPYQMPMPTQMPMQMPMPTQMPMQMPMPTQMPMQMESMEGIPPMKKKNKKSKHSSSSEE